MLPLELLKELFAEYGKNKFSYPCDELGRIQHEHAQMISELYKNDLIRRVGSRGTNLKKHFLIYQITQHGANRAGGIA